MKGFMKVRVRACKFCRLIVLAVLLCSCLSAQVMDIGTNFYRDYLDFAQNKGKFAPSNDPVTITQRNGEKFTFKRIPNRGARNNKGNYTSLGRNFVVTATHTLGAAAASNFSENRGWFGNTKYEYLISHQGDSTQKNYNSDTTYMRTTKYIVEGNIDPLDVPDLEISSTDQNKAEANAKKITDYIKKIKEKEANSGNNIMAYQAGTGLLALEKPKPKEESDGYNDVFTATEFEKQTENDKTLFNKSLGGSLNEISANYSAVYKAKHATINTPGVYLYMTTNKNFRNRLLPGDSGSGFFVYDTVKQKWVLVGVLSTVADYKNHASIVTKTDFDDYKKDYENSLSGANIQSNSLVKNKDNILSNKAEITLNSNLDLGHGGIVVKSGEVTLKNGTGSHKIAKFAGFDIADNASVNLQVSADTAIHKIGKGKLIVNSSNNKTLRLGEGLVEINKKDAFKDMYITSGRGTLKLGVDDNLDKKIFFGDGGGKLDLNGHNQNFSVVSANSNAANIINSSNQKSTLSINLDKDTIFHTNISDNIDIKHDGKNGTNGKELIFDGGFNVSGSAEFSNAKVTLQGHPTTHALADKSVLTQTVKDKLAAAGLTLPNYMDLTRPSTFAQPDWDEREFSANGGIKLNSTELTIGKYAQVKSDINAIHSTINLGGEVKHYIDKFDGSNTYNSSDSDDSLKYRQEIESQNLPVSEANFGHKITLDSYSKLRVGGAVKLKELIINATNSATNSVIGSGKFEIENLTVNSQNLLTFEPDTIISKRLKITNLSNTNAPALDFKKILTLGKGMNFEIDFASALHLEEGKEYALINAGSIINQGASFNLDQKNGNKFIHYTIKDGKILLSLSDKKGQNPSVTPQVKPETKPNHNGSHQNQNLHENAGSKIAEFNEQQNQILNIVKNQYKDRNISEIKQIVKKIDADMQEISKSSLDMSVHTLQTSNEIVNLRISNLLFAKADFSEFKLAALESDVNSPVAIVYEAIEANKRKNNVWANINGAYFKNEKIDGKLKFYGTNIGYDRIYDDLIVGVNFGVNKAKFSSNNLNDDAKIYNFGAYGFYEYNTHEFQGNLNFTLIDSTRYANDFPKADVKSNGVLFSGYYKNKILLKEGEYSHFMKPVFNVEFGKFKVNGLDNGAYKQKDINNFRSTLGFGAEYVLSGDKSSFIGQILVKKNFDSENKTYISLSNSNKYVDYKLDNSALSYNLNLTTNLKITKHLGASCQFVGMVDNNKNYGLSASAKVEYKF